MKTRFGMVHLKAGITRVSFKGGHYARTGRVLSCRVVRFRPSAAMRDFACIVHMCVFMLLTYAFMNEDRTGNSDQ